MNISSIDDSSFSVWSVGDGGTGVSTILNTHKKIILRIL